MTTTTRKALFAWYGGKYYLTNWLLPKVPYGNIYCEPFCGAASLFFARKPSKIEVLNDIDENVVQFFRVMQDPQARKQLIEKLEYTPYARNEFLFACEMLKRKTYRDAIEQAWAFFVRTQQQISSCSRGRSWSYSLDSSRQNMSMSVSRFRGKVKALQVPIDRLLAVQLECKPALDILTRYDTPNTVFYCDPPYLPQTRNTLDMYINEMTSQCHHDFLQCVVKLRGAVCISGYNNEMYNDILHGWIKCQTEISIAAKVKIVGEKKTSRIETLWRNQRALELLQCQQFWT